MLLPSQLTCSSITYCSVFCRNDVIADTAVSNIEAASDAWSAVGMQRLGIWGSMRPSIYSTVICMYSNWHHIQWSDDSRNMLCREGDHWVLNGHKWWASGAPDPRCGIGIFMGKSSLSAAQHKQQSMILVPMQSPGVKVIRPLTVYGYDDAPHGHAEVKFEVNYVLCTAIFMVMIIVASA